MARSEGYLGSKIDQKTHPRNQNQVHRAATRFLAGETVSFCADADAGPWFSPVFHGGLWRWQSIQAHVIQPLRVCENGVTSASRAPGTSCFLLSILYGIKSLVLCPCSHRLFHAASV